MLDGLRHSDRRVFDLAAGPGAGGRRRELRDPRRRDARTGRRIGQRQIGDGAVDHAAGPAARTHRRRPASVFKGRDLLTLSESEMRKVRGAEIALIFQEPMTALNPVFTDRRSDRRSAARPRPRDAPRGADARPIELLEAVRIPNAGRAGRRLSASAVRRHAPARADRHGHRVQAVAGHRRRADDGARRDDSGRDPRSAARDEDDARTCRCCSSPTISASSPKPPIASRSCTPDASSSTGRCARFFATRSIPTRAGCSHRCPAASAAAGCGPSRARSRCSARFPPAAPFTRAVPIDSSRAPARRRPTIAVGDGTRRALLPARQPDVLIAAPTAPAPHGSQSLMPLVEVSHLVKQFVRGGGCSARGTTGHAPWTT